MPQRPRCRSSCRGLSAFAAWPRSCGSRASKPQWDPRKHAFTDGVTRFHRVLRSRTSSPAECPGSPRPWAPLSVAVVASASAVLRPALPGTACCSSQAESPPSSSDRTPAMKSATGVCSYLSRPTRTVVHPGRPWLGFRFRSGWPPMVPCLVSSLVRLSKGRCAQPVAECAGGCGLLMGVAAHSDALRSEVQRVRVPRASGVSGAERASVEQASEGEVRVYICACACVRTQFHI